MGRVRGLLQARSLRARHRLSVRRRHRRAAAAGPAAGSRPRSLGDRRGRTQIAAGVRWRARRRTSRPCGRSSRTCASEGSGIRCSWSATGRPGSSGRSRNASPDRRASVASHTGCAISRPRSRRIHGRNSRPGSQPAIRRPRGESIARQLATGIRADYANVLPSALACFEDDFESCIAHLRLPVTHRRFVRTTNLLERLFVEERRRLKIIPNGFGEKPVLKLMFGALIRAAERWRGLRFTEFELRQIAAVRKDLDDEYQTLITPRAASSQPRISSKSKP